MKTASRPIPIRPLLCAALVLNTLAPSGEAAARTKPSVVEKASSDTGVHLSVDAVTVLPLHVGAQATLELPARLQVSLSLGALPAAFVALTNSALHGAGAYDQTTADLIDASQASGISLRVGLGWRPFPRSGLFISVGYGLVSMSGALVKDSLLSEALDDSALSAEALSAADAVGLDDLSVDTSLHMITAEIGYRWLFWRQQIVLRAALGFAGTLAANTTMTSTGSPASAAEASAVDALASGGAAFLDDIYTRYGFFPTASFSLGYRFF